MKALRSINGNLDLAEVPVPNSVGETLVKVSLSGICSTDLHIVRGYADFSGTLGHEFVGVVERSEEAPELVGKRVVGEINVGCGICQLCLANDPRHCAERTVLGIKGRDGAHAEYLSLPARNLIPVSDEITDEQAVFVEPLAAALGITEQVFIEKDTSVAVIGDGKLGLLCAMCLRLRSDHVTLIGRHSSKMNIARKRGVETVLRPTDRFDVVVEASGSESGFATALDLVRPRGKIVLKSTFHGLPTWEAWRVVVDEITVVGSRCGRFEPAIEMLAKNQIQTSDLIAQVFPFADAVTGFEKAGEKGVLKVILQMDGN